MSDFGLKMIHVHVNILFQVPRHIDRVNIELNIECGRVSETKLYDYREKMLYHEIQIYLYCYVHVFLFLHYS
jgi:hypothetical protein